MQNSQGHASRQLHIEQNTVQNTVVQPRVGQNTMQNTVVQPRVGQNTMQNTVIQPRVGHNTMQNTVIQPRVGHNTMQNTVIQPRVGHNTMQNTVTQSRVGQTATQNTNVPHVGQQTVHQAVPSNRSQTYRMSSGVSQQNLTGQANVGDTNTAQYVPVGNTAAMQTNTVSHTAVGASVAVPQESMGKRIQSTATFLRRAFTLNKNDIQRDIVREQGSYDYIFLIIVLVLIAFGSVMVYSASYAYSLNKYGDSYYIIFRQAIFIVVGFGGMIAAMLFKPEFYKKFAPFAYAIFFFVMMLVPIIGKTHKGAKRWISLGFTEIQPSEFMKLGLVLILAWYMDRYYERVTDYKNFWRSTFFGIITPFCIIGVTCFLVLIEKHLSGTIIMFLIGVIVIFAGGASVKVLAGLAGAGGIGLLLVGLFTDYTKRRFDIWLHPEHDPTGDGWQTLQGLYAIGSGGFFGVGLGESRQKHLYVSEPQNDFIFTIICEELGYVGAIAVVLLFFLFAYRGFVIAMKAPDTFSSLVVMGIVGKVTVQAILNIAVVTNTIPNTGIALPFFSYGGSSLCILMAEMGIVLSISRFSKQQK